MHHTKNDSTDTLMVSILLFKYVCLLPKGTMLQGVCYQKVHILPFLPPGCTMERFYWVNTLEPSETTDRGTLLLCSIQIHNLLIILAGLLIFITLNILTYFCQCVNNKRDKNGTSPRHVPTSISNFTILRYPINISSVDIIY